jgi:hypothetical protein
MVCHQLTQNNNTAKHKMVLQMDVMHYGTFKDEMYWFQFKEDFTTIG